MKTTNTKSNSRGSVVIIGFLVTFLLLMIAGFFVYKHQQHVQIVAKERAEYAQAEKSIGQMRSVLASEIGSPSDERIVKVCDRASSDFNTGALYCKFESYSLYKLKDPGGFNAMLVKLTSLDGVYASLKQSDNHYVSSDFYYGPVACFVDFNEQTNNEGLDGIGLSGVKIHNGESIGIIQFSCADPHISNPVYNLSKRY